MQEIVFATNNQHKLAELRRIVGDRYHILSLADIGCHEDIPETADTLEGNALQKARYIREHYGYDCFADDTGLMVDALGGAPGVYSARYAGPGHDSAANMRLLLANMEGKSNRSARFVTVIALLLDGCEMTFESTDSQNSDTQEPLHRAVSHVLRPKSDSGNNAGADGSVYSGKIHLCNGRSQSPLQTEIFPEFPEYADGSEPIFQHKYVKKTD